MSHENVDGKDKSRKQKMPSRPSWMGEGIRNPWTNCDWYLSINSYNLMNVELVKNQPGVEGCNMTIFSKNPNICVSWKKYESYSSIKCFVILDLWVLPTKETFKPLWPSWPSSYPSLVNKIERICVLTKLLSGCHHRNWIQL